MNRFKPRSTDHPRASLSAYAPAEASLRRAMTQLPWSDACYQALAAELQVGILIQLPNSEIVLCNPKALELLGLTEDQLLGRTSMDPEWNVIHPDGTPFPGPSRPVPQAIASRQPVRHVEMGVYRPQQRDRVWLLVNADPQLDANGQVVQVVCTLSDLTEHHASRSAQEQAEQNQRIAEALQERDAFTQAILNSVVVEIAVLDQDGTIIAANAPWQRFASDNRLRSGELPRNTDIGANYLSACDAAAKTSAGEANDAAAGIRAVLAGRLPEFGLEYPCHSPDEQRWFGMNVSPLRGTRRGGVVVSHRNITRRKLAEIARRNQEVELANAQRLAHIGSWYWDARTDETQASDELLRMFGVEAIPKFANQCGVFYTLETWQQLNAAVQQTLATGVGYDLELPALRGDGSALWIQTRCDPVRDASHTIVALRGTVQDITERIETARQLQAEQQRLQLVMEATNDGFWDWDVPSGKVYRSKHYYPLVGVPAEEDRQDFEFFKRTVHPDDLSHALQVIQAHQQGLLPSIEFEYRSPPSRDKLTWLRVKGRVVSRDAQGAPIRVLGTVSDITEKKLAEIALREREQQLARVIEGSDQGYWDLNVQTHEFHVSAREEEMLGYQPGEMNVALDHWPEHIHPDDYDMVMRSIAQHVAGETPGSEMEIRLKTKSGGWRWIFSRGRIVSWDDQGQPLMMSGTHSDITERKKFELAQREAATVFSSSYEGIMVVSPDLRILRVNPAFTRISGYTAEEAMGQSPQLLSSGKHDAIFFSDLWAAVKQQGFWSGEIWDRRKNGELYSALLSISVVRDAQGELQHYVGVFSDITKFKAHAEELDRAAHYDPLTGSPNRRLLSDRLEQAIHRSNRSGRSLAVCFLDLDQFKLINDQYGAPVGNRLLVGVNEHLKRVLRSDDTLARLAGDEFVLLLSDIDSSEECAQILDRVLLAVSSPVVVDDLTLTVTASIGVSLYPNDNVDADTLIRHADQAMYLAKEAGKNRYNLFDTENDRKVQAHRQYLEVLRQALKNKEFVLFYQPKVNLLSGALVGAEALIRWQHPQRGLVSPAEFLPHISGSDLETPLGEWVIQAALAQAAAWHRQGLTLCVSANISAQHLLQPGFHAYLASALAGQPDLPTTCFELEVLETAAIEDMELAVNIVKHCRELGVHFALDDFGTGYSSLTYLRKLPVDTLKIDQSFVRDMLVDADDHGIVEGVIRLGEAFKRHIIAEGVETLAIAAELLRMGCHLAQGYGIARPMPADQLSAWSDTWTREARWRGLV